MNDKLFDIYPWNLPKRDLTPSYSVASVSSNEYIKQLLLLHQCIACYDSSLLISSHHSGEFLWNCLLIKLLRSLLSVQSAINLNNSVDPKYRLLLVLTNQTKNHYDLLLRKHMLDLLKLEQSGLIKVITLFSTEEDKQQFLEDRRLFPTTNDTSESSPLTDYTLNLSWKEFSERLYNNFQFDEIEGGRGSQDKEDKSAVHYLMMIDDIDIFQTTGNCFLSSNPATANHKNPLLLPEHPYQILSHCLRSLQSLDPTLPNIGEIIPDTTAIPDSCENHIISFISYGKRPTEIPLQLPNLNFSSGYLDYTTTRSNERFRNGPYDEENHEPLLSEFLKYRSDLILEVTPLQTGHSTAVHGTITIHYQSIAQILSKNGRTKQALQYKATENAVLCHIVDS